MNHEFQTVAWVPDYFGITRQIPVTVSYGLDGHKPIGLWVYDEIGTDITCDISEAEYDVLYAKACDRAAESVAREIDICFGEK